MRGCLLEASGEKKTHPHSFFSDSDCGLCWVHMWCLPLPRPYLSSHREKEDTQSRARGFRWLCMPLFSGGRGGYSSPAGCVGFLLLAANSTPNIITALGCMIPPKENQQCSAMLSHSPFLHPSSDALHLNG